MTWSDMSELRWKDLKKAVKGVDRNAVLHRLGLEERTPASDFFAGLGLFAVGVLVGAGLGLLFAPRPGAETRSRLTGTLRSRGGRMAEELGERLGGEGEAASRLS